MSKFTVNFTANTTGDHIVAWRTYDDAPAEFHNIIVVPVTVPGAQAVDVEVEGNIYCANSNITYTGYIIAECQLNDSATLIATGIPTAADDTSLPLDIPDLATTWFLVVNQITDPCIETTITCESTVIDSVTIDDNGTSGCAPDATYPLTITEVTPGDEIIAADIDVIVSGGIVTSVVINNAGQYKAAPDLTHSIPSCSSSAAFTAVMADCPSLDLTTFDCAAQNDLSDTPDYIMALGDVLTICADDTTLGGLASNFADAPVGNCHCQDCANVTVDASGSSSGTGAKITYQTCWDGSNVLGDITMVTQEVPFGSTIQLGCIIPETIVIDQGTLDVNFTTSSVACT